MTTTMDQPLYWRKKQSMKIPQEEIVGFHLVILFSVKKMSNLVHPYAISVCAECNPTVKED